MSGDVKLTKALQDVLGVIPDWSAHYEIAARLGRGTSIQASGSLTKTLRELRRRDLAAFSGANATYRITPAGLAALTKAQGLKSEEI